ncbi:MAG: hypothetical protein HRT44_09615 [Bdellovibrionales bacterium]|nr:hypothetical protein [Bdellovibrionales bacterium]
MNHDDENYCNKEITEVNKKEFQNPAEVILDNLDEYVSQYQKCAGGEYKPSGADLVAQVCGGLCWYDGMNFNAEALSWPFPGYEMLVFHTGKKMETHEHLKDLKSLNLQQLIPILLAGRTSLDQKNLKVFCESVNYYYDALNELGLSDSTVYDSVMTLRDSEMVLGAKGCGALGMDTVIVVCESTNKEKVKELANQQDFQFISSTEKLHQGVSLGRQM